MSRERLDKIDVASIAISASAALSSLLPAVVVSGPGLDVQVGSRGAVADLAGRSYVYPFYPPLAAAALLATSTLLQLALYRRWWTRAISASLNTAATALAISAIYFTMIFLIRGLHILQTPVPYGTLYLFVNPRVTVGPFVPLTVASAAASWFNYLYHEGRTIVVTIRECLELEARRRYGVSFEELRASRPGIAKAMEDYAKFGALCWPVIVEGRQGTPKEGQGPKKWT